MPDQAIFEFRVGTRYCYLRISPFFRWLLYRFPDDNGTYWAWLKLSGFVGRPNRAYSMGRLPRRPH